MKKLTRSNENKMLSGVCGGIGEHMNIDPTIVRLVSVALSFISFGTFVIAYIAAALIIPFEDEEVE